MITPIDSEIKLKPSETYIKDCMFELKPGLDFEDQRSNIIIQGATRSGKSCLLHNILYKKLLKDVDPHNIYIFSKTAKFDLTYRPLIMYILDNTIGKLKQIYNEIDFNVMENIMKNQGDIMLSNMSLPKDKRQSLQKILCIFDDVIGDDQLKSYQSELSTYTTRSRHFNIINIFLVQNYTSLPSII